MVYSYVLYFRMTRSSYPKAPPRLRPVFSTYRHPVWYITLCTFNRRPVVATDAVFGVFTAFFERGEELDLAWVGQAVLMPDHIHVIVRPSRDVTISRWVSGFKRALAPKMVCEGVRWQPGFFDHLIRHGDSLDEKRAYVRMNPVRAGLVKRWEDWPYHWSRPMGRV